MTDGFDYDYVIVEDDEITIVRNDNRYTYDIDGIGGDLLAGAKANGVDIIYSIDERLDEWLQDVGGWNTDIDNNEREDDEYDDTWSND